MKILLVEDSKDIADALKINLTSELYTVDVAENGNDGSFMARTFEYDAILLDHFLPKKNGLIVCQEIRTAGKHTPILFLSVNSDPDIKISALNAGADDYIIKPCSTKEISARIKAVMRRPKTIRNNILENSGLKLDTQTYQVTKHNKVLHLTRKEFSMLEYFMRQPHKVLSRIDIMEHVWSADADPFSNTVESHILNLRKKINSPRQKLIKNIPGRGYIFNPEAIDRFE
jgi:DNA-binding response OmpR family regulator